MARSRAPLSVSARRRFEQLGGLSVAEAGVEPYWYAGWFDRLP